MTKYTLTNEAEKDLEEIALYGIEKFGIVKASEYHSGLEEQFEKIATNPKHGQRVDHVLQGYRRSVYVSHSIYYKVRPEDVLIVRVLGRQDARKQVPSSREFQ